MVIPDVQRPPLPVYVLLVANLISRIGNQFTLLAIPWFVLETTGSASSAGITVAVGVLPYVLAGVFGGPIVDRLGYRLSSIVSDVASGITVALIPLLHVTAGLAIWQLLLLVFRGALLDSPGASARRSLFPGWQGAARADQPPLSPHPGRSTRPPGDRSARSCARSPVGSSWRPRQVLPMASPLLPRGSGCRSERRKQRYPQPPA